MLFRESLACGLQKCVGNLWKGDDYSDFTIIVGNSSFECHRFILSACSGFFQGLFKSQMKEQREGHAKLEGMTASTFDTIITTVYKGIDGLTIDNILDVWAASEMLHIGYLTEQCLAFVMENISVNTCCRFLNHATQYAAKTVVDNCLDFICRNFNEIGSEELILCLPFEQFYQVIANDALAIDHEELVVNTVLNWVKSATLSGQSISLDCGNKTEDIDDTKDDDFPTNSLSSSESQENIHNDLAIVSGGVEPGVSNTCSPITGVEKVTDIKYHAVVPVECKNVSKEFNADTSYIENRKKHLVKLLSACRLFTIKSSILDTIMKNNIRLLVDTGAYPLMHEALMYTLDISRRHVAWPDAAVYRASGKYKHVMVFVSGDKVRTYDFNTGRVAEFAQLPLDCNSSSDITITIFDNILHVVFNKATTPGQQGFGMYAQTNSHINKEVYVLAKEKTWVKVNSMKDNRTVILLPQGNNIYHCYLSANPRHNIVGVQNKPGLYSFCCVYGHASDWSECCKLENYGNCLVRFHKYILVFVPKVNATAVECYNTETRQTHKCETSVSGTAENMVSFTHGTDVYILQRNGSLWKVFDTDTTPVDFELVSKLWDFDCCLKGGVLYRKTLFIFCNNKPFEITMSSLPGIFASIKIINIDSRTPCLPIIQKLAL